MINVLESYTANAHVLANDPWRISIDDVLDELFEILVNQLLAPIEIV